MTCSNCGSDLDQNSTMCPKCGTMVANPNNINQVPESVVNETVVVPGVSGLADQPAVPGVMPEQPMVNVDPNQGAVPITGQPVGPEIVQPMVDAAPVMSGVSPAVDQGMVQNAMPAVDPNQGMMPGVAPTAPVADQGMVQNQMPQQNVAPMSNQMPQQNVTPMPNQNVQDTNNIQQMVSDIRVDSVTQPSVGGKVNIIREKSLFGAIISFKVLVDGNEVGKLKNNSTLSYDLSFGPHQVILKSTGKDVVQDVDVSQSQPICDIKIGVKMGLIAGTPNIKEFSYRNQ